MLFFFNCVLLLNRSRAHPCTYTHFFLFLFFPPSFLSYIIYLFVHHFRSDFKQSVKHVALHFISVTKSLAQTKKCKTPPLFQKLYGSNVTTTATNATVLLKKSTFFPPIVAFIYLFIYLWIKIRYELHRRTKTLHGRIITWHHGAVEFWIPIGQKVSVRSLRHRLRH